MPKNSIHKVTAKVGASAEGFYFFLTNDANYPEVIATATGVTKAGDDDQDQPVTPVHELIQAGVLSRINVGYKDGTKQKSASLLVGKKKLGTVIDDLTGKAFRGGTIKRAGFPNRVSYY